MLPEFPTPHVFQYAIVKMSQTDRLSANGVDWKPLRIDGEGWRFRNEKDGEHEVFMSHRDLYGMLVGGAAKIRYGYNAPEHQKLRAIFGEKTFDDIVGKRRSLALFREELIRRYDLECLSLGKKPRWPAAEFKAKLRSWRKDILVEMLGLDEKSVEDTDDDGRADQEIEVKAFRAPSVKTFRRDYARYHGCGSDVLGIVHRHHGPGLHFRKVDPDSVAFAHKQAMQYMMPLKPSMAQVYRDYVAKLSEVNADRKVPLVKVTRSKFESIISKFDAFKKWDGRHGTASALKHFGMVKRGINALSAGERIEIDFWNVDLMTLFVETGMWSILPSAYREAIAGKRIWFVAAIDVATRYILAFRASLNPNAVSAVAAIRMIMSDKRHISDFVRAETPWGGFVQPRNIFSDNGKEFANDRVESVMRAAEITFNRPQAGKPQARPFVESLFHSIGPLIASYFEGRTFSSVAEKGDYNPEHHISLQADEVVRLFTFAICDIYHNKPHSGLGGATPHNAWVRATQEHGFVFPEMDAERMLRIFGERFKRRIGTYGITFMGVPFGNDKLHRQRTKYGQMEFEIKVDPENLKHILVLGDKGWFVVENLVGLDGSVSLAEWIAARNEIRRQNALEAEAGLEAMYRAINRLRAVGEAAALRANLTPRHLTANHYEILEGELFGAWEAVRSASTPALTQAFATPEDPLRSGSVGESVAILDYHEARKRDLRKDKGRAPIEQAPSQDTPPAISSDEYYGEY